MIFGMSFKKFSNSALELAWSEDRVNTFIIERGLESEVKAMKEKYPNIEKKLWSYYAVSKFIRDNFFDTYKGLMKRIKRNEDLGKTVGFIRSYHCGIRRVPMLTLAFNEEGRMRKDENMKEIANLVNITSNSTIQTDEICVVALGMLKWAESEYYTQAPIVGTVHDSIDSTIDKENAKVTMLAMKENFESDEDWQLGVKLLVDMTIVDFEDDNQYYKHGVELGELP
jgi:hypothetical protein